MNKESETAYEKLSRMINIAKKVPMAVFTKKLSIIIEKLFGREEIIPQHWRYMEHYVKRWQLSHLILNKNEQHEHTQIVHKIDLINIQERNLLNQLSRRCSAAVMHGS